jgi:hypothetical protein
MRTKTLLIAIGALAVGAFSSMAQVTSANIVGYANIVTAQANADYLITIPFKVGLSNGANEVFGTTLPDQSSILIWTGNDHFVTTTYAPGDYPPNGWEDNNQAQVSPPILPVGMGFFLIPGGNNVTNTFVGSVAINVGTSNSTVFTAASTPYLIASVVPYAGSVTNGNATGGGPNLNGLPDQSSVLLWNVDHFDTYVYAPGDYPPNGWEDSNQAQINPPILTVGQGFYLILGGSPLPYTWTTGL